MIDITSTDEYKKFITSLHADPKHVRSLYKREKRKHLEQHPELRGDCPDCRSIILVDAYLARMAS